MRRYKVELADFGAEFFRLIAHREVKKLPLFTDAEDAFIDKLASKAICETHPPNTAVFAINTPADSICFILSGDYIVVGETGLVHAQMEAGAFFGEVGVLLGMDRTASIVSGKKADNTLFKLTKEVLIEVAAQYPRFWSEIQAAAEERYALIKKRRGASTENQGGLVGVGAYGGANTMALGAAGTLAAPDTGLDELTKSAMGSFDELDLEISLQSLGRLSIFKGLGAGVLSRLALLMERQMWREGDTIIQCGDDAEAMFFLAAGDVNVISEFGDVVDECSGPGSFFGEVALLENVKRTATITCRSPTCSTYSLKNADLKKLLNEDPDFKKIIHESAKDRMQKFLMRNILA
ncbi:cyclic nucleotide-binding-like protein [Zopfochytrium polystomum]|nr:cyclic nucleotide-binding-like protein [Zopfochytrium polystomum]